MTISTNELRQLLFAAGIPATFRQLPDASYETISDESVLEIWEAWLAARPNELVEFQDVGGKRIPYRPTWLVDSSDCDNLALGLVVHAQVGNALRARRRGNRGGLALGFHFFTQVDPAGGHAANWYLTHEWKLRFFEPATGLPLSMSEPEIASAWFGFAS